MEFVGAGVLAGTLCVASSALASGHGGDCAKLAAVLEQGDVSVSMLMARLEAGEDVRETLGVELEAIAREAKIGLANGMSQVNEVEMRAMVAAEEAAAASVEMLRGGLGALEKYREVLFARLNVLAAPGGCGGTVEAGAACGSEVEALGKAAEELGKAVFALKAVAETAAVRGALARYWTVYAGLCG